MDLLDSEEFVVATHLLAPEDLERVLKFASRIDFGDYNGERSYFVNRATGLPLGDARYAVAGLVCRHIAPTGVVIYCRDIRDADADAIVASFEKCPSIRHITLQAYGDVRDYPLLFSRVCRVVRDSRSLDWVVFNVDAASSGALFDALGTNASVQIVNVEVYAAVVEGQGGGQLFPVRAFCNFIASNNTVHRIRVDSRDAQFDPDRGAIADALEKNISVVDFRMSTGLAISDLRRDLNTVADVRIHAVCAANALLFTSDRLSPEQRARVDRALVGLRRADADSLIRRCQEAGGDWENRELTRLLRGITQAPLAALLEADPGPAWDRASSSSAAAAAAPSGSSAARRFFDNRSCDRSSVLSITAALGGASFLPSRDAHRAAARHEDRPPDTNGASAKRRA